MAAGLDLPEVQRGIKLPKATQSCLSLAGSGTGLPDHAMQEAASWTRGREQIQSKARANHFVEAKGEDSAEVQHCERGSGLRKEAFAARADF